MNRKREGNSERDEHSSGELVGNQENVVSGKQTSKDKQSMPLKGKETRKHQLDLVPRR